MDWSMPPLRDEDSQREWERTRSCKDKDEINMPFFPHIHEKMTGMMWRTWEVRTKGSNWMKWTVSQPLCVLEQVIDWIHINLSGKSFWQGNMGWCIQGQIKEKWHFILLLLSQDKEYLAQVCKSGNRDQKMIWKKNALYKDLW